MKTPVEQAIEALERFRPCDHPEYEECGSAAIWRKCNGCGLQFESKQHEAIKSRAADFDAALASLKSMEPRLTVGDAKDVIHAWMTANHNGWSQDAINQDLTDRLTQSAKP